VRYTGDCKQWPLPPCADEENNTAINCGTWKHATTCTFYSFCEDDWLYRGNTRISCYPAVESRFCRTTV